MVGRELLFTVSEDGFSSSDLFKITDKGRKFLRVYDGLQSLME
jgi:predicted transcriptional regulator